MELFKETSNGSKPYFESLGSASLQEDTLGIKQQHFLNVKKINK